MSLESCLIANADNLDVLRWLDAVWSRRWTAELMAKTAGEDEAAVELYTAALWSRISELGDRMFNLQVFTRLGTASIARYP